MDNDNSQADTSGNVFNGSGQTANTGEDIQSGSQNTSFENVGQSDVQMPPQDQVEQDTSFVPTNENDGTGGTVMGTNGGKLQPSAVAGSMQNDLSNEAGAAEQVPKDMDIGQNMPPQSGTQFVTEVPEPLQVPPDNTQKKETSQASDPLAPATNVPMQSSAPPPQPSSDVPSNNESEAKEDKKESDNKPLGAVSTDHLSTLPKKGSRFRIFVIVAVILIIIIYSIVGYLYLQNQKGNAQAPSVPQFLGQEKGEPSPTPTPKFDPSQVKIKNGNVVREVTTDDVRTLLTKDDYQDTGITGFAKAIVSPDNTKICVESWPPSPSPSLYLVNSDGSNVLLVSQNRQNCLWSKDSQKIYYKNTGVSTPPSDIFVFDIESHDETNLTNANDLYPDRVYDIVGLSADGSELICTYQDTSSEGGEAGGDCRIDLTNGEVTTS